MGITKSDSMDEAEMLNSYDLTECKHCGSTDFISYGRNRYGVKRYRCKSCGKLFSIVTNTVFDNHKIPISEWMEFMLGVFRFQSFQSIGRSLRITDTTVKYWISKLFLLLSDYQNDIVLRGDVQIDETFYKVIKKDIRKRDETHEYRGLSKNQICIGIGCDASHTLCIIEGYGKPSRKSTAEVFSNHIEHGSNLTHDEEKAHNILVEMLGLSSRTFNAKALKGIKDDDNPLDKINEKCRLLKRFLYAHSGFDRSCLQDYLNLFSFICNPPCDHFEKVEKLEPSCISVGKRGKSI